MPTKEALVRIDFKDTVNLLIYLIDNVRAYGSLFVLQQVYELCIVLLSISSGKEYAVDGPGKEGYKDWPLLIIVRNTISHNFYDIVSVGQSVSDILHCDILQRLCADCLGEEMIAYPLMQALEVDIERLQKEIESIR